MSDGRFLEGRNDAKNASNTTRGIKELVLPEPSMHLAAVFLQEFNSILVFGGSLCFGYCLELENLQFNMFCAKFPGAVHEGFKASPLRKRNKIFVFDSSETLWTLDLQDREWSLVSKSEVFKDN